MFIAGDFHFLWECLRVVYMIFWGTLPEPGSLCNLREIARRTQVDKAVRVFNVGDEFLVPTFKITSTLSKLNIKEVSDSVHHSTSQEWLKETAMKIVSSTLMPTDRH